MINWKEYIISNKDILQGKPIIKGTRISVEFILQRFANGWTEQDLLENYPSLSKTALKAVFGYVYDCLRDGMLFMPKEIRA